MRAIRQPSGSPRDTWYPAPQPRRRRWPPSERRRSARAMRVGIVTSSRMSCGSKEKITEAISPNPSGSGPNAPAFAAASIARAPPGRMHSSRSAVGSESGDRAVAPDHEQDVSRSARDCGVERTAICVTSFDVRGKRKGDPSICTWRIRAPPRSAAAGWGRGVRGVGLHPVSASPRQRASWPEEPALPMAAPARPARFRLAWVGESVSAKAESDAWRLRRSRVAPVEPPPDRPCRRAGADPTPGFR